MAKDRSWGFDECKEQYGFMKIAYNNGNVRVTDKGGITDGYYMIYPKNTFLDLDAIDRGREHIKDVWKVTLDTAESDSEYIRVVTNKDTVMYQKDVFVIFLDGNKNEYFISEKYFKKFDFNTCTVFKHDSFLIIFNQYGAMCGLIMLVKRSLLK